VRSQRAVNFFRGLLLHARYHVAVDAQRRRYVRVAGRFLYHLYMRPHLQMDRGKPMAKVVEPSSLNAKAATQLAKRLW
jgi:hypothetical protein